MTFIRNIWYVMAWTTDMEEGKPLGRTIIGEPVVVWRDSKGELVAMEDRCPHRHAALSLGRLEGDSIKCMYHGLTFSKEGECTNVPGSDKVPPNCTIKTYPVTEKDDWIWVWMGDPAKADESLIPEAFGLDNEKYKQIEGGLNYDANYQLINDNLADLSHVDFVHEKTLSVRVNNTFSKELWDIKAIEGGLYMTRWLHETIDESNPMQLDAWHTYHYMVPGLYLQKVFLYPAGTAKKCDFKAPPEDIPALIEQVDQQAVTPISETETQYLYAMGFNKAKAPPPAPGGGGEKTSVLTAAFLEDKEMIEAQQKIWNLTSPDKKKAFLPKDKAPSMFRKLIERRIAAET